MKRIDFHYDFWKLLWICLERESVLNESHCDTCCNSITLITIALCTGHSTSTWKVYASYQDFYGILPGNNLDRER